MWQAPAPQFEITTLGLPGGKAGAFATVRHMRALVRENVRSPEILNAVASIIFLMPQHDQFAEVEAIFNFVRGQIRYMRDVVGVETLATPQMTMRRRVGDCDDQSTLLCTLCEAAGYPTRFVLAGYNGPEFEHVYCQIFLNGDWINADPTESHALGWEPPGAVVQWFERV